MPGDIESKLETAIDAEIKAAQAEEDIDAAQAAATLAAAASASVAAADAAVALAKTESANAAQAAAETINKNEGELSWLKQNQVQLMSGMQNLAKQLEQHQTQLITTVETLAALSVSPPSTQSETPSLQVDLTQKEVEAGPEGRVEKQAEASAASQQSRRPSQEKSKPRRWI